MKGREVDEILPCGGLLIRSSRPQRKWLSPANVFRKLTGRRRGRRNRKALLQASVVLVGSGALWWVALGPAPTVETVVVMADKEANDARADSPLQLSTREGVNCPRCDPGGDMPISSVDFEAFEVSERLRDQQQLPSRVLATLDLKPGQRIADVGAGSGYFSYFFSDVVGAQGTVWAVEISGKAVDFLNRRLEACTPPHPNIRVVQSRKDDIRLEPGSLDWAFLCNVHLMLTEDAGDQELGLTCLKSIYRALKPGGRLVITGVTSGSRTSMDLSVLQGRPLHLMGSGGRSQRTFVDMMKVVNHGSLRGVVGQVFPLEEVSQAHQMMDGRDFFGKLVIES